MLSYPKNLARFPKEAERPPHTHTNRRQAHPRWPSPRLQPEPGWPSRPAVAFFAPGLSGSPSSSALGTPAPTHIYLTSLLAAELKKQGSRLVLWGTREGGCPRCGLRKCPFRAPHLSRGHKPCTRPAPRPTPPPEPKHLFCTQLTAAGLSLRRPQQLFSPSSRGALHPPAGGRSAPWPWHLGSRSGRPGWLAPAAHNCPPAASVVDSHHEARRERPPQRTVPEASATRVVPQARAGGGCQRASASTAPGVAPHASGTRASLRCTQLGRGASWRGGRGRPGGAGNGKKTEQRERNQEARN